MSKDIPLTLGQAACKLNVAIPTAENRNAWKQHYKKSDNSVCYLKSEGTQTPVLVPRVLVAHEPYKYLEYADSDGKTDEEEEFEEEEKEEDVEVLPIITRKGALDFLKAIMTKTKPGNEDMYQERHLTISDFVSLLDTRFRNIKQAQLVQWLSNDSHFSASIKQNNSRGRFMFVLKNKYHPRQSTLTPEEFKNFLYSHANTTNIGYARKSDTRENKQNRIKCCQRMVEILKNQCHARRVYVSPCSNIMTSISERDKSKRYTNEIHNIKGDTEDLIQYLEAEQRDCRLITLEYSGLSNNIIDLQDFLKKYKQIKDIVVYTGGVFDIIERNSILNYGEHTAIKFQPRQNYKRRSL